VNSSNNSSAGYSNVGGADLELAIMTEIFHLRSLHWGHWEEGQELSLEGLRTAQENFTNKLAGLIPKDVKTVLDVGAGIGDVAMAMAKKGLEITSISPDPYHKNHFNEITKEFSNIKFVQSKYEDLDLDQKFDMVLMSESCGYFPIVEGLEQTLRYLKPNGYLIIACMFKTKEMKDSENYKYFHRLDDYLAEAKKRGLELTYDEDVTNQVTPSLDYTYHLYKDYFGPG